MRSMAAAMAERLSPAEWAERHLTDDHGQPLVLQPWQRQLVERAMDGKRVVLVAPQKGGRCSTLWLWLSLGRHRG